MRWTIILLASLLFAGTAWGQAANDWTGCSGSGSAAPSTTVGTGSLLCYEFDESQGAVATSGFNITAAQASVCLNRNITDSDAGSAAIEVQWCAPGTTASDNTCATVDTLATDTCASYSRGFYRLNVSVAATATEDAKVSIRGY